MRSDKRKLFKVYLPIRFIPVELEEFMYENYRFFSWGVGICTVFYLIFINKISVTVFKFLFLIDSLRLLVFFINFTTPVQLFSFRFAKIQVCLLHFFRKTIWERDPFEVNHCLLFDHPMSTNYTLTRKSEDIEKMIATIRKVFFPFRVLLRKKRPVLRSSIFPWHSTP